MMEFLVLGSGSAGNAMLVITPETRLMVDAGLSARQLVARLKGSGVDPSSLDGILLSHEHGDHTRGVEVFCRSHGVPVICNRMTQRVLADTMRHAPVWRLVESGAAFAVGDLRIETFSVPHDAVDPMGFVIERAGARLGIATDLGHVDHLVRHKLRGVQALVVEANYDEDLLQADLKRPWRTKQRIASHHGHLSNGQAAELAAELAGHGLARIVLAHLSRDCNSPRHIRDAFNCHALLGGVELHFASQTECLGRFSVAPAAAPPLTGPDANPGGENFLR